jgi:cytoskeletal protein CcmA (bactofilin family)
LFNKKKNKNKNIRVATSDLSIISSGVKVAGDITTTGSIRVDGIVDGGVFANGLLILGETGEIKGDIKGHTVNLGGKIDGAVNAADKITLESKCVLNGDITSKILVIEPGAFFNGKSSMSASDSEFSFDDEK